MLKSSLLNILRTFSKDEMARFHDLAASPYFNKKGNVTKLLAEIRKYHPDLTAENLDKEKLWHRLFPGKKYNYGIMKNLIHDLNKLCMKFLEIENYSAKKLDTEMSILEQYFSRKLSKNYLKKSAEIKQLLSLERPTAELYDREFALGRKDLDYLYANYNAKNVRNFDYMSLDKSLVLSFFAKYFHFSASINFEQTYISINSEKDFQNSVLELYQKSGFRSYYTDIFYYMFRISCDRKDVESYNRLKDLWFDSFGKLTRADQYTVVEALLLFSMYRTNSGDAGYELERFSYYKKMDEHNLFLNEGTNQIEGYLFINTNVGACTAGEFDWAERFIDRYKGNLPAGERQKFVNLAYTHLYFKKKDFEKALACLAKCGNVNGVEKVNVQTYQMFLYFELGYYDELKNLVDSCRHFIRNDKTVTGEVKTLYGRFIEAVNRLNEYRYKKEHSAARPPGLEPVRRYITENEMPHKGWLNQKLSSLANPQP
ncbi:MAG: hypothetical protein JNK43_02595 [Ignavibacteria bacterium]|nr:hypothetical protein [Ignavibacteria bacterium]